MKVLVLGSGVAGLTTALEAARAGHDVTVLTKAAATESNTRWAQGGVAVVTSADDSIESHVADTLVAGAGLSHRPAVEALCAGGPGAIGDLVDRGVEFDPGRGLEAAHSAARILHAGGDATGAAISGALIAAVHAADISLLEDTTVAELVLDGDRVVGVRLLDGGELFADAVVLATGGAGQVFPFTTNPEVATGDGLAMALRAGAVAADLEFVQFHPTALAVPGSPLVSEAVRGEGAVLLDADGHRFMTGVHPDAELAPRDVVARGIAEAMAGGRQVVLDATAFGADFLARRFPTIDAAVRARGFDWASEPIPVAPAAHYLMGGVRTDVHGRTSLPGLFAVGEVACNGLHGANRLASNSLLEGAVYGARVVEALGHDTVPSFDDSWAAPITVTEAASGTPIARADLQHLMWEAAGLTRDEAGLRRALDVLSRHAGPEVLDQKSAEDAHLLVVARAMVASALARRSSRGAHFRSDFPQTDADARHSTVVMTRA